MADPMSQQHDHHHDHHHHDHEHDHSHDAAGGTVLSDVELRVRALESILVEKGYVDPAALDALIETYETRVGPHNTAHVLAKAWSDQGYHAWLMQDAKAAIHSLGYTGRPGLHSVPAATTHAVPPQEIGIAACSRNST